MIFSTFFDALDGSGVVANSSDNSRISRPNSHDDMHSLPRSDQSAENTRPLNQPALKHLPSPDKKGIVMGWLNTSQDAQTEQEVFSQPPELPVSQASASPSYASATADTPAPAADGNRERLFDAPSNGHANFPRASSPIERPSLSLPPPPTFGSSSSVGASPSKRTPSFWDDSDVAEPESANHLLGLVRREEPGETDEECQTPGVHTDGVPRVQSRTSTVSRETLTLPLHASRDSPTLGPRSAGLSEAAQPEVRKEGKRSCFPGLKYRTSSSEHVWTEASLQVLG